MPSTYKTSAGKALEIESPAEVLKRAEANAREELDRFVTLAFNCISFSRITKIQFDFQLSDIVLSKATDVMKQAGWKLQAISDGRCVLSPLEKS